MPFYEYQCTECGTVQESFQKMSDAPLEKCEKCGGKLREVLHPVAIHFKGSGFYTTDYGKGKKKGSDGPDGYSVLQQEKERRAEKGDPVAVRAIEGDSRYTGSGASASSSGSSSRKDDKPKEKQKAT